MEQSVGRCWDTVLALSLTAFGNERYCSCSEEEQACLSGEGCDSGSCVPPTEVILCASADTCMSDILGLDNVTEVILPSVSINKAVVNY